MAHILVVEDDEDIRSLSKMLLELLGHTVDEVSSGERALLKLRSRRYHIVLTDLGLPGMDGWAVATLVKRLSPHSHVGLVSGWEVPPPKSKMAGNGVDFLVPKPFGLVEMEEALAPFI